MFKKAFALAALAGSLTLPPALMAQQKGPKTGNPAPADTSALMDVPVEAAAFLKDGGTIILDADVFADPAELEKAKAGTLPKPEEITSLVKQAWLKITTGTTLEDYKNRGSERLLKSMSDRLKEVEDELLKKSGVHFMIVPDPSILYIKNAGPAPKVTQA